MNKKLLTFIFVLSLSFSVFAQEQPPADLSQSQEKSSSKLVTAIEVKGNKSISSNNIISKLKTRPGSPYQDNIISDDLKRLYILGYFSDVKINSEDYKDGIKVIITVEERPLIDKIILRVSNAVKISYVSVKCQQNYADTIISALEYRTPKTMNDNC